MSDLKDLWPKLSEKITMSSDSATRGQIMGKYVRIPLFAGTIFSISGGNKQVLLTDDIDFINQEYETVNVDENMLKPLYPHLIGDEWGPILGDLEINKPYVWFAASHKYAGWSAPNTMACELSLKAQVQGEKPKVLATTYYRVGHCDQIQGYDFGIMHSKGPLREENNSDVPQKIKSLEEWKNWYWTKLAMEIRTGSGNRYRSARASYLKNKEWAGSWFRIPRLSKGKPISQQKYVMLTPDLDFIDNDYQDFDVADDENLLSTHPANVPNSDEIMSDFMISQWRQFSCTGRRVAFYVNGLPQYLFIIERHDIPEKVKIFGTDKKKWSTYSFNIFDDPPHISEFISDRSGANPLRYELNGNLIDPSTNLAEADIIDFGFEKQKRDQRKKSQDDLSKIIRQTTSLGQRIKYKWLITYNKPAENELKVLGYYPQQMWYTDKKQHVKINAKQYLTQMSEKYPHEGALIMWRLDNSIDGKPERIFEKGEIIDVAEIDNTYATGEYKPYSIKYIKSHLRLVHY